MRDLCFRKSLTVKRIAALLGVERRHPTTKKAIGHQPIASNYEEITPCLNSIRNSRDVRDVRRNQRLESKNDRAIGSARGDRSSGRRIIAIGRNLD
jgi:hypothetical protein